MVRRCVPSASGSGPAGLRIEAVRHVSAPSRFPIARAADRAQWAGRGRSSRAARPGLARSKCCATRVFGVKLRLLCWSRPSSRSMLLRECA